MATMKEQIDELNVKLAMAYKETVDTETRCEELVKDKNEAIKDANSYYQLSQRYLKIIENLSEK